MLTKKTMLKTKLLVKWKCNLGKFGGIMKKKKNLLPTLECLNIISYLNEVCGVAVKEDSLTEISKNLRFAGDNYESTKELNEIVEECKNLLPFASTTSLCDLSFAPAIVCATSAPVVFAMSQHLFAKKYLKDINRVANEEATNMYLEYCFGLKENRDFLSFDEIREQAKLYEKQKVLQSLNLDDMEK